MPCPVMGWRATYHHCGLFPTVDSTEPRCPQCTARRGCGMLQDADIPVLICEVVVVFSPKSSRQEIFGDVGRNRLNGLQSWHLFVDLASTNIFLRSQPVNIQHIPTITFS
jgi:hypothetical protein